MVRRQPHVAGRRDRDQVAAAQSGIHDAAHQGRDLRPTARADRGTAQHRHRRTRRAGAGVRDRHGLHAVPGHLRRAVVQARMATGQRRRAIARESGRRHPAADRLDTRHAAGRSNVRQRHVHRRGRADRTRHRAGRGPAFRLRKSHALRCRRVAAPEGASAGRQARGWRARRAGRCTVDLRQRRVRRHARQGRRKPAARRRTNGPAQATRCARHRGTMRHTGRAGGQSALRRANRHARPRRPHGRWRRHGIPARPSGRCGQRVLPLVRRRAQAAVPRLARVRAQRRSYAARPDAAARIDEDAVVQRRA
ncbi:Methyltransferase (EC 2.1.1.-) [Mycetohabitans rhizoxinica HKI 454]|uniref:Methyltransferase n=1 Tax=Mycetohabitans rhizoxinica (strain DSM 19002 / CIP 109453 / HKI 454) TaxID=882378 RepID=E5AM55_MYCRK|nr:Methyltransferase (EC 2.1.1.-) [Mycetohabitans rhizoxinica HKI 454]